MKRAMNLTARSHWSDLPSLPEHSVERETRVRQRKLRRCFSALASARLLRKLCGRLRRRVIRMDTRFELTRSLSGRIALATCVAAGRVDVSGSARSTSLQEVQPRLPRRRRSADITSPSGIAERREVVLHERLRRLRTRPLRLGRHRGRDNRRRRTRGGRRTRRGRRLRVVRAAAGEHEDERGHGPRENSPAAHHALPSGPRSAWKVPTRPPRAIPPRPDLWTTTSRRRGPPRRSTSHPAR